MQPEQAQCQIKPQSQHPIRRLAKDDLAIAVQFCIGNRHGVCQGGLVSSHDLCLNVSPVEVPYKWWR